MEENIVEELSRRYCKKEKIIKTMIEKCTELGYNTEKTKGLIKEFYTVATCPKLVQSFRKLQKHTERYRMQKDYKTIDISMIQKTIE